jgi:hypothetical protein
LFWLCGNAQEVSDEELAHLLSNQDTQRRTVDRIVVSGNKLPLLLSWSTKPPSGLDPFELEALNVGLADVFGQLKTRGAIPFLVKNISMQRSIFSMPAIGLKTYKVVLERMPAVAALINIGTPALRPLEDAYNNVPPPENRLPIMFTISHIVTAMSKQDSEKENAQAFLGSALAELNLQRRYAQDALNVLEHLDH